MADPIHKEGGHEYRSTVGSFLRILAVLLCLPQPPDDGLNPFVFPVAVLLAQKKPIALRLWFRGSLFARLDECGRHIAPSIGRYNVICYAEVKFLQVYLWERFVLLGLVPLEFPPVPVRKIQGEQS